MTETATALAVPPRPQRPSPAAVGLAAKVRFLKERQNYPERPSRVVPIETHMSWVFLTDAHAYKLKKPVRHSFLDYSTVEARRRNCLRELRLNRRLAPGVYLAVLPLRRDPSGRLSLDRAGEIVDWLVKMRRLPADRTLEYELKHRTLRKEELRGVASLLARFYRSAPRPPIAARSYRRRLETDIRANRLELLRLRWRLPAERIRKATGPLLDFLHRQPRLLDARVRERRIVEAHGDLRPEHLYLGAEPAVTDCLEFNRSFRILDPADELGYLALECDMLGGGEVGRELIRLYRNLSGDRPPARLLHFYMSARACLRAKLAIWHLKDRSERHRAKWRRKALRYLRLACAHADALAGS